MDMDKFTVINEKYEFKEGEVLLVFKLDDKDKEYVLYAIDNSNDNNCSLIIAHLEKDEKGYDVLKDIDNLEERKKVIGVIKDIIKGDDKNH